MTKRNPESQGREEWAGLEAIEPFSENGVGVPFTRWWTEQNPPESKEEAVGFGVVVPDETVPPVDEPVLLGAASNVRVFFTRTSEPWRIDGLEALVVSGTSRGLSGELAGSYLAALPPLAHQDLLEAVRVAVQGRLEPSTPHLVRPKHTAGQPAVIVASAFPPGSGVATLEGVALAANAVLRLAVREKIRKLAMPLIGAGGGGLVDDKIEIAKRILAAALVLEPHVELDVHVVDREFLPSIGGSVREAAAATSVAPVRGSRLHLAREASDAEGALRAAEYAAALSTLFSLAGADFSFALFGHWGRGKTYLMGQVSRRLEQDYAYAAVRFSAWAYPQTPVLWAYLYECVAERALAGTWPVRIGRTLRAGLARHGAGGVLVGLLLFGLGAVPLGFWLELGQQLYALVGLAGLFMLIRVARRGSTLGQRLRDYLLFPRHDEHLGLQAVIGRDLAALLIGWIPNGPPVSRPVAALYFLLCGGAAAALFPWHAAHGSGVRWLGVGLAALWLGVGATLGALALYRGGAPRRVLLVVDDLDRCEPARMLEVIENLRLFLESQGVGERMQVAMLVDESALGLALAGKYRSHGELPLSPALLLEESVEKLFLVYLRLPPLTGEDVDELVEKYFSELRRAQVRPRPAGDVREDRSAAPPVTRAAELPVPEDRSATVAGGEPLGNRAAQQLDALTFSAEEETILRRELRALAQRRVGRIGPRTVRSVLLRYQLARLLLDATGEELDVTELVGALVGTHAATPADEQASARLLRVVNQVCLPPPVSV